MHRPDTVLIKVLSFIWSLAPSQNARWFAFSLIVLVISLVLIFVAGYILIARLDNYMTNSNLLRAGIDILLFHVSQAVSVCDQVGILPLKNKPANTY